MHSGWTHFTEIVSKKLPSSLEASLLPLACFRFCPPGVALDDELLWLEFVEVEDRVTGFELVDGSDCGGRSLDEDRV